MVGRPPKTIKPTANGRQTKSTKPTEDESAIIDNDEVFNEKNAMGMLKQVHESQIFIARQNDDMLQELKKLRQENETLKKNQEISNNTIKNLKSRLNDVEYKLAEKEQQELDCTINLNGLPNISLQESASVLIQISEGLDIGITEDDIINIKKLENKKTKKIDYSYEFKNSKIRSLFLMKRMEKKIFVTSSKEVICTKDTLPNANRLYINEPLTKFNFNLLNHAKSLKQHGYTYVWYKFGKIFVRKTGNSNIILIRSLNEINDLISRLPNSQL